jgi:hypothetical protein
MHISFEGTYEGGHRIGDTIAYAYAARLMAENEIRTPRITMTFSRHHLFNFFFDQFIRDYDVECHYTDTIPGPQRFGVFDDIRKSRSFNRKPIGSYKELYRRIDGQIRQTIICGEERPLTPGGNIFTYICRGQESCQAVIKSDFTPAAFGWEWTPYSGGKSVFVSPHELSQGNETFTIAFWMKTVSMLLDCGIQVMVASHHSELWDSRASVFFAVTPRHLVDVISRQSLVLTGNTGTGWIAAAVGCPMIACEPESLIFEGWRFERCGFRNLVRSIKEPNPDALLAEALTFLEL